MTIPSDIRERILQAATSLYEQADRQSFPTVDQVRRAARVDMNAASTVMREWRRAQTVRATPVAVQIPDAVGQANSRALAELWQAAQELANESLRTAQAAWEAERAEQDQMRQELAEAFEAQAGELDQVKEQAAAEQAHQAAIKDLTAELDSVRADLAQALTRAERAEAKAGEIERRASDLRTELDRAHQDIDQVRAALSEQAAALRAAQDAAAVAEAEKNAAIASGKEENERIRSLANEERGRLADELVSARHEASAAREHAAELSGRLSALQEQNTALLARLPSAATPSRKRKTPDQS